MTFVPVLVVGLVLKGAVVHEEEVWIMGDLPTMMMVRATENTKMNAFCLRAVLAAKYSTMEASITMAAIDCEEENPNISTQFIL